METQVSPNLRTVCLPADPTSHGAVSARGGRIAFSSALRRASREGFNHDKGRECIEGLAHATRGLYTMVVERHRLVATRSACCA